MDSLLKLRTQPKIRVYALLVLALLLVLTGEALALIYEWNRQVELLFCLPAGMFMMLMDFLSRYKTHKGLFRTVNIFGVGLLLIFADIACYMFLGYRVLAWAICIIYIFYFFSIAAQLQARFREKEHRGKEID